jgi:hypothetical protein
MYVGKPSLGVSLALPDKNVTPNVWYAPLSTTEVTVKI